MFQLQMVIMRMDTSKKRSAEFCLGLTYQDFHMYEGCSESNASYLFPLKLQ